MKRLIFILFAFISIGCYSQDIEVGENYINYYYSYVNYVPTELNHLEFIDSIIKSNHHINYINFYSKKGFVKSIKAKNFTTDRERLCKTIHKQSLKKTIIEGMQEFIREQNNIDTNESHSIITTNKGTVDVDSYGKFGGYIIKDKRGKLVDSGTFSTY